MTTSEKAFQTALLEAIRLSGGMVYHAHDSRRQVRSGEGYALVGDADAKGYPDLTILTRKREVIWAELKSPKGKVTAEQAAWLRNLPPHKAFLWRPADFDDAARIVQEGHGHFDFEQSCISCNPELLP